VLAIDYCVGDRDVGTHLALANPACTAASLIYAYTEVVKEREKPVASTKRELIHGERDVVIKPPPAYKRATVNLRVHLPKL
jgi:hypothetical protein